MLSGFLKPNGDFVDIPYMGHLDWADDELKRLGIVVPKTNPSGKLSERGYVQISDGYPFFANEQGFVKLSSGQLDFFLMNIDQLDPRAKSNLTEFFEVIFP